VNAEKQKKTFEEMVLEWLLDYCSVFEKADFDEMPPHCPWDHKIELVNRAHPPDHAQIIPLSDEETQILDEFLDKNLCTGQIRESKSPWASPFFFVKRRWKALLCTRLLSIKCTYQEKLDTITIDNRDH